MATRVNERFPAVASRREPLQAQRGTGATPERTSSGLRAQDPRQVRDGFEGTSSLSQGLRPRVALDGARGPEPRERPSPRA
jgi:hypothetical protein